MMEGKKKVNEGMKEGGREERKGGTLLEEGNREEMKNKGRKKEKLVRDRTSEITLWTSQAKMRRFCKDLTDLKILVVKRQQEEKKKSLESGAIEKWKSCRWFVPRTKFSDEWRSLDWMSFMSKSPADWEKERKKETGEQIKVSEM